MYSCICMYVYFDHIHPHYPASVNLSLSSEPPPFSFFSLSFSCDSISLSRVAYRTMDEGYLQEHGHLSWGYTTEETVRPLANINLLRVVGASWDPPHFMIFVEFLACKCLSVKVWIWLAFRGCILFPDSQFCCSYEICDEPFGASFMFTLVILDDYISH